jgi:hypothetical protein
VRKLITDGFIGQAEEYLFTSAQHALKRERFVKLEYNPSQVVQCLNTQEGLLQMEKQFIKYKKNFYTKTGSKLRAVVVTSNCSATAYHIQSKEVIEIIEQLFKSGQGIPFVGALNPIMDEP